MNTRQRFIFPVDVCSLWKADRVGVRGIIMELNITKFVDETCPRDYQASIAEIGANAGADTWRAACDDSVDYMFVNDDTRDEIRAHFKAYGACTDDEINAWTDIELNALVIQDVSGVLREFNELANADWQKWLELWEAGTCSSRLYGGEMSVDGEIYFQIGD